MNKSENKAIAAAKAYIEGGIKSQYEKFSLGLELEHFLVDAKTLRSIEYFGENGVAAVMEELSPHFETVVRKDEFVLALGNDDYTITLEPAAQLEISIRPCSDIAEIVRIYKDFRCLIDPVLNKRGLKLINLGYHPVSKVDDLPLIPKDRYKFMYNHFAKTGRYGKNMMKGTAATQVSIDYYSEKDFIKKYKIACRLSPFLSLLSDNAPVFEGAENKEFILRTKLWRDVDTARTDYCGFACDAGISFDSYADFVTASPLIVEYGETGCTTKSAQEIYADEEPAQEEVRHIFSMSFPTVRLKTYIEIRYADSLSPDLAVSYVALIKGLFENTEDIESYLNTLPISTLEDIKNAENEIMKKGLSAEISGITAADIIKKVFSVAEKNLNAGEREYLKPLKKLVCEEKRLPRETAATRLKECCSLV